MLWCILASNFTKILLHCTVTESYTWTTSLFQNGQFSQDQQADVAVCKATIRGDGWSWKTQYSSSETIMCQQWQQAIEMSNPAGFSLATNTSIFRPLMSSDHGSSPTWKIWQLTQQDLFPSHLGRWVLKNVMLRNNIKGVENRGNFYANVERLDVWFMSVWLSTILYANKNCRQLNIFKVMFVLNCITAKKWGINLFLFFSNVIVCFSPSRVNFPPTLIV